MRQIPLVMARFRSSLHPVNSVKNIIDSTQIGVTGATVAQISLAATVEDFTGATGQVPIGARVNSVFLFVQILAQSTGVANVDWYIAKVGTGQVASMPVPGATGGSTMRKYILHEEKGIPGNASDGAYPATFKGSIKIPRHMQRFGDGDNLRIHLRGTDDYNLCVKCIYKFVR